MDWISTITFDQIAMSLVAVSGLRALLVVALPDRIAGPGGWLVDTRR